MSKAFMFSGQGAQFASMGKDFYELDIVKDIYKRASIKLGYSLEEISFNEDDRLNQTIYTQPAIFTMCVAIFEVLKDKGIKPDYVLGLSLGEYAALYSALAFDLETGLEIIQARASIMQEVCDKTNGGMIAVLGMDREIVERVIKEFNYEIANYNCPGQIVVGGDKSLLKEVSEKLIENGAKRAIPLNVSGAFHTSYMDEASDKFNNFLQSASINEPNKNIIMNVTGKPYDKDITKYMTNQVNSSVRFEDSIKYLIEQGVDEFIEIGPGKVLSGFVKKVDRKLSIKNIQFVSDLEGVS